MAQRKHEPGPPMDLANMRRQGVHSLICYCLNDACCHQALMAQAVLGFEVSDEALESAAGAEMGAPFTMGSCTGLTVARRGSAC
jgi:hypothetical protein